MSQHKSANRTQSHQESSDSQHHRNARQLQELFSNWSLDDLELLLSEVNGDVDLAATKVSDGTAVPWGEVPRKKDKKVPTSAHTPKPSSSGRGDARRARGGRGGRGGAGRGVPQQPENLTTTSTSSGGATPSTWGHPTEINGNATTHAAAPTQASKARATSKLSFAQVARSQEKAPSPAQVQPPVVTPQQIPSTPVPGPQPELEPNGWEDPTTAEAPTWEEPQPTEVWAPAEVSETLKAEALVDVSEEELPKDTGNVPEVVAEPSETITAISAPIIASIPVLPSPKLTRPAASSSHRSSARHKIPDQPVTLPVSFGGIEKVGMQFGSLNLGESAIETPQPEPEEVATIPEQTPAPAAQPVEISPSIPAPPPATAPAASASLTSMFQQQQLAPSAPQPQPSLPTAQSSVSHHGLSSSVSQPIASNQTATHATASPLPPQTFTQQPIPHNVVQQSQHQHQPQPPPQQSQQLPHLPQLPQQLQQNQTVHSFSQHGLPLHLDPSQQTQVQQQPHQNASHSTYFRGSEPSATSPYFHAPTPPVAQDNSYSSFGQLSAQNQHQQPPHLGAFGNNDYGYADAARDFYNSYSQQQAFASRNVLGHEDVKGLSGGQQTSTSTVPPSSAHAQGPAVHSSQGSNQPQTPGGQGPQQYPPPVPYYYPPAFSQGQYYGTPYSSGYVPQPFVKYPAMFQPPGPGSTANPTTKQPGGNAVVVQPQTNPYGQLYQQGGYDDYQGHPHHAQHHHQHNHSLGLGQGGVADYSKQLYAGTAGNMQGFIGLGGQTGAGPTSNAGPRGGSSPDTPYKPYTSKDVGVTSGRNVPSQGQVAPQSQNPAGQNAQGQSFYPGNRFGSGVSSSGGGGTGGPQQGGPHVAYPQAVNEASYYGYQPRQQPFWS